MRPAGKEKNRSIRRMVKKRSSKRIFWSAIFIVSIFFFVLLMMQYEPMQRKYLYPFPHQEIIEKYSNQYKVDVDLIASVINRESKFKNDAKSHRGALGLMQIMPDTAKWIANENNDEDFSLDMLHYPDTNIRYGVWYLSSLQEEFKNNEVLMLAAYNAGRGNVHEWMEEHGWDYDFQDVEAIPFDETRHYVQAVIEGKAKYKKLYQNIR